MDSHEMTRQLNLLIVEDDCEAARSELRRLKRYWHSITLANNASDGLEAISTGEYDVALSDWDCPNGGGEQVVRDSTIPVVIHTGNSEVPELCHDAKVVMKPACVEAINNALLEAYLEGIRTTERAS